MWHSVINATVHSGSNFALHIGDYKFTWFRYQSFYGSKVRMGVSKDNVPISGDMSYTNIPVEMIRLRWVKQGNTITWYREGKRKIHQIKEKGRMKKNSTIRLETARYHGDDLEVGAHGGGGRSFVRIDTLSFLGKVDTERLKE